MIAAFELSQRDALRMRDSEKALCRSKAAVDAARDPMIDLRGDSIRLRAREEKPLDAGRNQTDKLTPDREARLRLKASQFTGCDVSCVFP